MLSTQEIKKRLEEMVLGNDELEIEVSENHITITDNEEFTATNYYNTKRNLKEIINVGNSEIQLDSFMKYLELLDKDLFMTIDNIYFINGEEDLNNFYSEYPEQYMELTNKTVLSSYIDDVIAINIPYIVDNINAMESNGFGLEEDFAKKLSASTLGCLIVGLRESMSYNAIITDEELLCDVGGSDKHEMYSRNKISEILSKTNQINFFK